MLIVIRNTPLEYVTVTLTILAPFSLLKDCRQPLSLVLLTTQSYHKSVLRTSVLFKIIPSCSKSSSDFLFFFFMILSSDSKPGRLFFYVNGDAQHNSLNAASNRCISPLPVVAKRSSGIPYFFRIPSFFLSRTCCFSLAA